MPNKNNQHEIKKPWGEVVSSSGWCQTLSTLELLLSSRRPFHTGLSHVFPSYWPRLPPAGTNRQAGSRPTSPFPWDPSLATWELSPRSPSHPINSQDSETWDWSECLWSILNTSTPNCTCHLKALHAFLKHHLRKRAALKSSVLSWPVQVNSFVTAIKGPLSFIVSSLLILLII